MEEGGKCCVAEDIMVGGEMARCGRMKCEGFGSSSKKRREGSGTESAGTERWSTAGFCWTGPTPHDLSPRGDLDCQWVGAGNWDIPAKVLRARKRRDTRCTCGICVRAVRQAGCELGDPPRELPGFAHGCAGGPAYGESGVGHGTRCEWGAVSPPFPHWLRRALRVPGWD